VTRTEAAAFLAAIPIPEGFTAESFEIEAWRPGDPGAPAIRYCGNGITIELQTQPSDKPEYVEASGHTSFTSTRGVRTFDRMGVSDSFTVDGARSSTPDTPASAGEKLLVQIQRVGEARVRLDASLPVPALPGGFILTPERQVQLAKLLQEGREISLTPSGFGTGYRLTTLRPHRRRALYVKPGAPALAAFFGVRAVWIEPLDCD
jgi:hypothetical protein